MSTPWAQEDTETMETMWAEGASASQIARALGGRVSRSAVLGKVFRLKGGAGNHPPRIRTRAPATPRDRIVNIRPRVKAPYMPPPPVIAEPPLVREDGSIVTIADVRLTECRWPIGEVTHEMQMCGHATTKPGAPWCAFHQRAAWSPSKARVAG